MKQSEKSTHGKRHHRLRPAVHPYSGLAGVRQLRELSDDGEDNDPEQGGEDSGREEDEDSDSDEDEDAGGDEDENVQR